MSRQELVTVDPDVAEAAAWVREAVERSFAAHIEIGRRLISIRGRWEKEPGKWSQLLGRGEKDGLLPFGKSHAYRLIAIAENEDRLVPHGGQLPVDAHALYELTRLDAPTFKARLADGTIRPEMQRRDIVALVKQAKRRQIVADARDPGLLPVDQDFAVIYADVPSAFETYGEAGMDRAPENYYRTMPWPEIEAMGADVARCAAPDAVLFFWVRNSMRDQASACMRAWGFEPKTVAFTWVKVDASGKPIKGNGYYSRQQTEQVMVGLRGRMPERLYADVDEVIFAPRGEHSEKPEEIARRIERLFAGPYLELFGRRERKGWTVWGDQVGVLPPAPPAERITVSIGGGVAAITRHKPNSEPAEAPSADGLSVDAAPDASDGSAESGAPKAADVERVSASAVSGVEIPAFLRRHG